MDENKGFIAIELNGHLSSASSPSSKSFPARLPPLRAPSSSPTRHFFRREERKEEKRWKLGLIFHFCGEKKRETELRELYDGFKLLVTPELLNF